MALITCPECGHQVSDMAETCPGCGIKVARILKERNAQEQKPQAEKTGGKRKTLPLLAVSFVIALVLCGIGYYYYADAQRQKEQSDYANAMCSTDPFVMQMYLTRYADAPQEHRDSVGARMTMLTRQDNDWTNAVASGARSELERYVKEHPASPHKGEALNKIDSIDYAVASRKNTREAYESYLAIHPEGKYANQAQDFIDAKKATEVQPEELAMARNVCKHFFQAINSRNEAKLLETVPDILLSFLNRNGATASDVVSFMNRLYKDDITNMNWHILDDFNAEKVKAADDTYNIKVQFPAEQRIERTDATKEKYGKYAITAEITPDGRITRFGMKRLSE